MSKNNSALNMKKLSMVMVFYMILSYIIGPIIGYYLIGKNVASIGNGLIIGSITSIILWYTYGRHMV